jgi:predicted nuclease with RNAse H fold
MTAAVTIGVDLAAQPERTVAARVHWDAAEAADAALPVEYIERVDDAILLALFEEGAKVGLDCPLGWPSAFVDTLAAHHAGRPLPARTRHGRLDALSFRVTDEVVLALPGGRRPLSVATDLLGVVALRAVHVLDELTRRGVTIDRSGRTGPVAETYPAAAVRAWNLNPGGSYKRADEQSGALRDGIVARLEDGLGRRFDEPTRQAARRSHDHLDALLCALVARAVERGQTLTPADAAQVQAAVTEGWIHVPTGPLAGLL